MDKYKLFKSLHFAEQPLFLGNVHDVLSAMILEYTGFKAIGTTSWGVSNTFGYQDGENLDFKDYLNVVKRIIKNVTIPVSVDIEAGYGKNIYTICKNVLAVAECGAVGINIEDSLKVRHGLRDINQHCALLEHLRIKLDQNGFKDFFINARTDTYLQQVSQPLAETLQRGKSYSEYGADGLFVPGIFCEDDIITLVQHLSLPLNVLSFLELNDMKKLNHLGVKRFSFGNALSDFIIANTIDTAKKIFDSNNTAMLYRNIPPIRLNFKKKLI